MNVIVEELRRLNERTMLLEYDRKDLKKWAGDDLTQRFFAIRNRLQAPENDLGYWIKKGDLQAFEDMIKGWETGAIKSKTQKKKEERIAGADLILNEKGWKVYHVTTYKAAAQLGSNTTWCITGRYKGAESKGEYYFNNYISNYDLDGGYYFIFDTMNKDHNDVAKYCAGITPSGRMRFLYNGMQDREISDKGIPNVTPDRQIDLIPTHPNIHIPFNNKFEVIDGVLKKIDYDFVEKGEVNLPEGVTVIPKLFFEDKRRITVVNLPNSIKKIGLGAFSKSDIESLTIQSQISGLELGTGLCFDCPKLRLVRIEGNVQKIPSKAFAYCDNLSVIWIKQATEIADNAFTGCSDDLKIYTDAENIIEYALDHNIECYSIDTGAKWDQVPSYPPEADPEAEVLNPSAEDLASLDDIE